MLAGLLYGRSPQPSSIELRESFAMWSLNLTNLTHDPPKQASLPVLETGFWHHQILLDGEPKAYARSKVLPKKPSNVVEVAISPLARRIDEAIDWVESPERAWASSDLIHVQLLAIESLLIYALRLVEPKKVYIIDAFPEFINLPPGQLLDERAFLGALYTDLRSQEEKYGDRHHGQ
jgi:hypothetical protein